MKIKTIVSALTAMSLAFGGLAFAQQGRDDHRNRGWQERGQQDRNDGRRSNNPRNYRNDERGAGPNHKFHRGERLPREYRSSHYVVDDWRGHRLSAPPRGYHWVQTGGDYVLVGIASGIILQLLLNN